MKIIIQPTAKKDLKKLEKNVVEVILRKLCSIRDNPIRYIIRLKDSPLWKLRIGDYRVIMVVDTKNEKLNIIKIGHRKNVYHQL
ncbi:MAG: type II toxin-antitoxin system RelE/ParE family toxin [Candidatus Woesearchaeota archaeon]|jgi:mRNA interferase RelE/StbE|nr:type II toxin-antitoxin system RelE/ParE family toxin [Candidatus Woesearchaeota archaeon]MDP7180828.1 type II toxin-antitoxin system RelE/ParE family toxin [Candidatus Woesearchaeota archaeon]MDP7457230.1 type II toxin-antitoxin system RelE/ParE family toxin [Candidatus Woesearchaeota archaeon]